MLISEFLLMRLLFNNLIRFNGVRGRHVGHRKLLDASQFGCDSGLCGPIRDQFSEGIDWKITKVLEIPTLGPDTTDVRLQNQFQVIQFACRSGFYLISLRAYSLIL